PLRPPHPRPLFPYTTLFRSAPCGAPAFAAVLTWVATTRSAVLGFLYLFVFSLGMSVLLVVVGFFSGALAALPRAGAWMVWIKRADRKSTRLNSSHDQISYAV